MTAPRVSVAVRVACPSGWPYAGRWTTPSAPTAPVLLVAQVTVEPFGPVAGRVRSPVTAEVSPSDRAAVSASTAAVLVPSARVAASSAVSARE